MSKRRPSEQSRVGLYALVCPVSILLLSFFDFKILRRRFDCFVYSREHDSGNRTLHYIHRVETCSDDESISSFNVTAQ